MGADNPPLRDDDISSSQGDSLGPGGGDADGTDAGDGTDRADGVDGTDVSDSGLGGDADGTDR